MRRSADVDGPATSQSPRRAGGAPKKRGVSPLTVIGVILITLGLIGLGYVGWEMWGTTWVSQREAQDEVTQLQEQWSTTSPAPVDPDDPDAAADEAAPEASSTAWLLRIPALGDDYVKPIVAGIEPSDLSRGVGWYPTSALPGQVGNFALAGHRITRGEPFRRLLELGVGDQVIIETQTAIYYYELTSPASELTVQDTESWVLDPVPGHPDTEPVEALITLTTCEDFFRSPDRSVAFGKLTKVENK